MLKPQGFALPFDSVRSGNESHASMIGRGCFSRKERSKGDTAVWGVDENANIGRYQRGSFSPKYHFDTVFTEDKDNEYVYDRIGGEVASTLFCFVSFRVLDCRNGNEWCQWYHFRIWRHKQR